MNYNKPFYFLCSVWMLVFFFSTANAQDTVVYNITLEEAVLLALKQNPDIESARLEVEKSDARVLEAWGYAMPSIDLSGNYVHFLDKPKSYFPDAIYYPLRKLMDSTYVVPKVTGQLIEMPFSMNPNYNASASLSFKQVVFNSAVFIGVGAANVYSDLARDLYKSKELEIVSSVRKAYYQALLTKDVAELMASSLVNAEQNLKNVRLLKEQGIVSEYDELRAAVNVENLRPSVIQSENTAFLALENLRNLIGISGDAQVMLSGKMEYEPVDDSLITTAESMMFESNPNLNAVKRQIELDGAFVNAERSNYLPTIALFGSYSYSAIKDRFNFSTNDFYKSSQIGLSVSLNLFQGMQTFAKVEQAQLEQRKSEERRTTIERNLRTGIYSARRNLEQARKRVEAQGKTVEMAQKGYKIVTARFLSSAATQLEVNDAQLALTQAQVNRVQAIYDYSVAAVDLDQLTGRLPSYVIDDEQYQSVKRELQ
ncbi:MAG: TolC family protein [Bacteroidetes bacterium]|nr:TolC family protein [Bacteroidota bacterium]